MNDKANLISEICESILKTPKRLYMTEQLNLVTIRRAHQETGASQSFIKQLMRENKLTRYKINSATYVSLKEFESLASSKK